nr:MAG TPA: hypothetical protein [Caudoviricetes sp.]
MTPYVYVQSFIWFLLAPWDSSLGAVFVSGRRLHRPENSTLEIKGVYDKIDFEFVPWGRFRFWKTSSQTRKFHP